MTPIITHPRAPICPITPDQVPIYAELASELGDPTTSPGESL